MKNELSAFYDDLKKAREKCPWAGKQTLLEHVHELENEIEEVKQAIERNDDKNLKEELGDVFMNALFLLIIAEDNGINSSEVVKMVNDKLIRRKPWVFGNIKVNSKEEAIKMWNEIKRKEKGKTK
jgi:uncharacterized protein YabN with tetrapyrrole methylase and pyrophosphatase domain